MAARMGKASLIDSGCLDHQQHEPQRRPLALILCTGTSSRIRTIQHGLLRYTSHSSFEWTIHNLQLLATTFIYNMLAICCHEPHIWLWRQFKAHPSCELPSLAISLQAPFLDELHKQVQPWWACLASLRGV